MKFRNLAQTAFAILAAVALAASAARGQTIIGTGNSSSYLVIQAPDTPAFGSLFYQVFYNYDPGVNLDTYYLLNLVTAADPTLSINYINYGSPDAPNYFIDSITHSGTTLTGTSTPPFSPFWYQAVSGGESGSPVIAPIASGAWQEGSGVSVRYITPGSWDGFVYGEFGDNPSIAPVPEPSSWLLLGAGGAFLLLLKRRKTHA